MTMQSDMPPPALVAVPFSAAHPLPALIAAAGERAAYRFLEFFTAQIRNPNTRRAYARGVGDFLAWLERAGIASIADVSSVHVAAYVEDLTRRQSAPSLRPLRGDFRRRGPLCPWHDGSGGMTVPDSPRE